MSSNFTNLTNDFIAEEYFLPYLQPEDMGEFLVKLRQYLNSMAQVINRKDSGQYLAQEVITGSTFLPTFSTGSANLLNRSVVRKVIDTGALPNSTTSTTAHGITTTQNYSFTKIYGCATDPGASTITAAIPLPFINTGTPGDSVQLDIDATNVRITTTTGNYTAYTRSFVVLEYIQNL